MARHPFGGTVWDWVMARHQSSPLAPVVAALQVTRVSFFTAESGGAAVLDLQDSAGNAVVAVDTDENGFLPTFFGPDNVTTLWADAGTGDRRLMVARDSMGPKGDTGLKGDTGNTGAAGGSDASFAAFVNDPASATRAGLSATYAAQTTVDDQGLYVAPGGSDSNNGRSAGNALATLGAALAKLPTGAGSRGRVTVLPGTYTLPAGGISGVYDNVEIVGLGNAGHSTALGGGPGAVTFIVPDGAVGLTIGDGTNRFRGPVLKNLHFKANSAASLGGVRLRGMSDYLLENVVCSGFTGGSAYGFLLDAGAAGLTMYGSLVECRANECTIGLDNFGGSGVNLIGCTFDANHNNAGVLLAGSTGVRTRGANAQVFCYGTRVQSHATAFDIAGGEGSQLVGVRCEGFDTAVIINQPGVAVLGGSFNNNLYATAQSVGTIGTAFQVLAAVTGYRLFASNVASVATEFNLDSTSVGVFINQNGTYSSGFSTVSARHQVNTRGGGVIGQLITGFAGQTADLAQYRISGGSTSSGFNKDGYPFVRRNSAPADADLVASQAMWWLDDTNGAVKAMFKAKQADGSVVSGAVPLTPSGLNTITRARTTDAAPINNSTILVADGILSVTLDPNTTYRVLGDLFYDASQAADLKVGWGIPSGASGFWTLDGLTTAATSSTGGVFRGRVAFSGTTSVGGIGVGTAGTVCARPAGVITTGATGGTLALQTAQQTADPSDLVLRAGSSLTVTRVS